MEKIFFLLALAVSYSGAASLNDNSRSTRIIDGDLAEANAFQYATSLQLQGAQSPLFGHRCGGVLITRQHSLTAASCLYDINGLVPTLINATHYHIFAGGRAFNDTAQDRRRNVANFTLPDTFLFSSRLNDIAIVTTLAPFPETAITLNLPDVDYDPADFTDCTVAGWGSTTTTTNATDFLRFARKYVYNQNMCATIYNSDLFMPNVMPTMICAATYNSLSASCLGDTGNALVCNGTLTGILFHGHNCGATTFPELYTRVNNYTTWIRTFSRSSSIFAPGAFMLVLLSALIFFNA